jgi:hypothetical protein
MPTKTKTFPRETHLGKVSQLGAPMGNDGLFFKNYNKHTSKRARIMDINDTYKWKAKPQPFQKRAHVFAPANVEMNEFDARNPDRRGYKRGKENLGDKPLKWSPSDKFNPAIVGAAAAIRSGYFQGGINDFTKKEKQYHNKESGVWMGDQNKKVDRKDAVAFKKKSINAFAPKVKSTLHIKYSMR